MQIRILLTLCIVLVGTCLFGQQKKNKVGVKLGLNFFQFNGPLESEAESFDLNSGFVFGLNYTYYANYFLGFRAELVYAQKGSKRRYSGDSYAILKGFPSTSAEVSDIITRGIELGQGELDVEYSFGYVSLPFSVVVNPISKIELFGGFSLDFLVSPVANGNYFFESNEFPDQIFFRQSLEHRYNSDIAQGFNFNTGTVIILIPSEDGGDDEEFALPRSVGAYYYYNESIDGSFVNWFDIGLHGGASYYINPGLFVGVEFNYSLLDLTNEEFDITLETLDESNNFITRDDKDTHIGFQVFFGFRF